MRDLLRTITFNGIALYFTSLFFSGLQIPSSIESMIVVSIVFTIVSSLITPIFNVFLAPVNMLSLGLLSSLIYFIALFVVTKLRVGLSIVPFDFPGLTFIGIHIQPFHASQFLSYLLISVIIFFIVKVANWLADV